MNSIPSKPFLRRLGAPLVLLCALLAAAPATTRADEPGITVFAAASLTDVLGELGAAFSREHRTPVRFSFAASSTLARQIENGAAADIFISADAEWMDYLQQRNLIRPDTRGDVAGNRLVLVAPADSRIELKIAPRFALLAALGSGRLATGDPDSVPVGRYARESLAALGVWQEVEGRLIRADSVRSALAFVDRGEAPLGIVYATDAAIDKKVRTVDEFADALHRPIVYPAALGAAAKAGAGRFLDFIRGPKGQAAFERYGFVAVHP